MTVYLVRSTSVYSASGIVCNPNGSVEEIAAGYSPLWDIQLFFTVNMPVKGSLSFTQAKMIDASWDFVFGRGGQAIAGMVAYRVLRHSVQLYMEDTALPIQTVASICCQQGIQPVSVWEFGRATIARTPKSLRKEKPRIVKMVRYSACIFVCVYVLSFATLASVMTGYIADLEGWFGFKEKGETLEPVDELGRAYHFLLDGDRVNATKERYILRNNKIDTDPF